MAHKIHSKWLTTREVRIYCIDFSGIERDKKALKAEIKAVESVIGHLPDSRLLATMDLNQVDMMDDLVIFLKTRCGTEHNPFRKLAVMGMSWQQRLWLRLSKGLIWPKNVVFLENYETAKTWLVGEGF